MQGIIYAMVFRFHWILLESNVLFQNVKIYNTLEITFFATA